MRQATDHRKKHFTMAALVLCFLLLFAGGCGARKEAGQQKTFEMLEDFNGQDVGTFTGATYEQLMAEDYEGIAWHYYDDTATMIAALQKGDIATIVLDSPVAELTAAQFPDELAIFPQVITACDFSMILKKDSSLTEPVSEVVRELKADGTVDMLKKKWFSGDDEIMRIDWSQYDTTDRGNGVLRLAFDPSLIPMASIGEDGNPAGLEIELALMNGRGVYQFKSSYHHDVCAAGTGGSRRQLFRGHGGALRERGFLRILLFRRSGLFVQERFPPRDGGVRFGRRGSRIRFRA